MERAFAYQTDGIIGENTFFISPPKYGSWVTLGLILLDISLPAWPPRTTPIQRMFEMRAMQGGLPYRSPVCPPYRLNPWHCLSYITQAGALSPFFSETFGIQNIRL